MCHLYVTNHRYLLFRINVVKPITIYRWYQWCSSGIFPLVNYGKSQFLLGILTVNGHVQWLCNKLPEGKCGKSPF